MSKEDIRQNHTCLSCSKLIDSRDLASMQCGHPFHYQCLQISLGEQIKKQSYPVCCSVRDCCIEPSMYFMSVVLEDSEFKNYLNLEKINMQAFQNYECPCCDQSFLAYSSNKIHKCLKCYKIVCLTCSQLDHPGKQCKLTNLQDKKSQLPSLKSSLLQKKSLTSTSHSSKRSKSMAKKIDSEQVSSSSSSQQSSTSTNETTEKKGIENSVNNFSVKIINSHRKYSTASTAAAAAAATTTTTTTNNSATPNIMGINSQNQKKNSIMNSNDMIYSSIQKNRSKNIFQPVIFQQRQISIDAAYILRENSNSLLNSNLRKSIKQFNVHVIANEESNEGNKNQITMNSVKKHNKILQQKHSC